MKGLAPAPTTTSCARIGSPPRMPARYFAAASRNGSMPAEGVYPCLPSRIARMPASCTCSGAGKSGWPMQKLTMSLPCAASAVTSASTTKAFSVPSDWARLLIWVMAYFSRAGSGRLHPAVAPFRELEALDRTAKAVPLRVARIARQRDVGAPAFLVVPDEGHRHGRRPLHGGAQRGIDRGVCAKHLDALGGCRRELHAAVVPLAQGLFGRDPQAFGRLVAVDARLLPFGRAREEKARVEAPG